MLSSVDEILGTINDSNNDIDIDITNFISTSMKNTAGENNDDENNLHIHKNIIDENNTDNTGNNSNDVNYDITDLRSFISSNVQPSEVWMLKHYFGHVKLCNCF